MGAQTHVFGIFSSFVGIVVYFLASLGFKGIVMGTIITVYFGAVMNKAVLEIYREISERQSEIIEDMSVGI